MKMDLALHEDESTDLKSFYLDVDSGKLMVNGEEIHNVTAEEAVKIRDDYFPEWRIEDLFATELEKEVVQRWHCIK